MTSETIRIHPLSDRQERRLLDYLDEKYLEIHQQYSRRHDPESKLPTLRAYLLAMRSLFSLTLQIPPVPPSGMLRISLLLRFTGTAIEDIPGYSPDGTDLIPLLEWLDMLDRSWLSVLCGQAWDPVRGEGVELPEESLEKTPLPTQTDCTRVHSMLITGVSTLENWIEGKDEEDSLMHDMRRLGHQSTFDELFHRTLTKLHEFGPGEGADEEELLARLPSWGTTEENPNGYVIGMDVDGVETDGSNEDMEEMLYEHT